jgi:hypothetical protein
MELVEGFRSILSGCEYGNISTVFDQKAEGNAPISSSKRTERPPGCIAANFESSNTRVSMMTHCDERKVSLLKVHHLDRSITYKVALLVVLQCRKYFAQHRCS